MQSTSSGEAEFYGATSVVMDGRIVKVLMEWIGYRVLYTLYTDSSAAKAMMNREGVGKVKHLDVRALWIQAERRDRGLQVRKIAGIVNPADLGTKAHTVERFRMLRDLAGITDCARIDDFAELETAAVEAAGGGRNGLRRASMSKAGALVAILGGVCADATEVVLAGGDELRLRAVHPGEGACHGRGVLIAAVMTLAVILMTFVVLLRRREAKGAESSSEAGRPTLIVSPAEMEAGRGRTASVERETQTDERTPRRSVVGTVFVTPKGAKYHMSRTCTGLAKATLGVFARDPCAICGTGDQPQCWT